MLQFNFRTHGHSFQSSSHIHSDNWLDWVSCFFMLAFEIYAANSKSKRCKSSGNGAPYSCRQRYAWPMVLQIWAYLWFIGLNTFCYPSLIWKEWDIKKGKLTWFWPNVYSMRGICIENRIFVNQIWTIFCKQTQF